MKNDVIIIGGGAAGLCAAVALKKKSPRLSVRLLEAMPRVGKKLALTGNGRCNITNRDIESGRYHGKNPEFCRYALEKYSGYETESFFSGIGVSFSYEGEKAYPASFQAASVVDCLRFAADEAGVTVMTETKVTKIQTSGGLFKVIAGNMNFMAENVIIAAGLLSGGDRLGCDGEMLELLKKHRPKGVLHSFSGSAEMAAEILKLGMYLGIGGALTFKNARRLPEVVEMLPLNRLLLETDAPYMTPVPYRSKLNHSAMIYFTAAKIAEIKNTSPETILNTSKENTEKLFGI